MSAATPYLAEEAAALGDKELPPRCHPHKSYPPHVNEELLYAANLFQRAERAISAELAALAAAGVEFDDGVTMAVTGYLAGLAALAQLTAIRSQEARANGL